MSLDDVIRRWTPGPDRDPFARRRFALVRAAMRAEGAAAAPAVALVSIALVGAYLPAYFAFGPVASLVLVTAGPVVFALASLALASRTMPVRLRAALETFSWTGRQEWLAFRAVAGDGLFPSDRATARRWLHDHPDLALRTPGRVELVALTGDPRATREAAEGLPADTSLEVVVRDGTLAWIDWLETGRADLAPMKAAALGVVDTEGSRFAGALVAMMQARLAVSAGDDWKAPLAAYRPVLGPRADGIRRYERGRLIVFHLVVGIVVCIIVALVVGTL